MVFHERKSEIASPSARNDTSEGDSNDTSYNLSLRAEGEAISTLKFLNIKSMSESLMAGVAVGY